MRRTSGVIPAKVEKNYQHRGGLQPTAADVHVDFTPEFSERVAARSYQEAAPGGAPYKRFTVFSVWRALSEPPQDWPLALCDSRSVDDAEVRSNILHIRDAMPSEEEMMGPIPGEEANPAAAIFFYNPNLRWYYYPNMTRDELLVFKFHDSDQSLAWRTPHVAFHDRSEPNAKVRKSIEMRVIAYYL